MTAPIRLGSRAYYSAGYASTLDTSSDPIDFGSGAGRWIQVTVNNSNNGVTPDSVAIAGGGTLTADTTVATPTGSPGNGRAFRMTGDGGSAVPSGTATVTATMSSSSGYIQMVVTWGYGATAISSSAFDSAGSSENVYNISGTTADDLCVVSGFLTAQTAAGGNAWTAPFVTATASQGSTLGIFSNPPAGFLSSFSIYEAGAATSTALGLTIAGYQYTPGHGGWVFKVTGTTPTGPTIDTQPTAQSADEGSTAVFSVAATTSGGTLGYQWKRQPPVGGAFSNVGANSSTYTTATLDCATDHGANVYCAVSDSNGTTNTSTVGLTVRAVTTTSRPVADVDTAGWTASTGTDFFALIDETTYSLTDYIDSPTITASPDWVTFTLSYPRATGDHVIPVWASVPGGTGTLRVRLEDDSATVVGSAADQAVTGTATLYELPITISGPATRVSYAFVT